MSRIAGSGMVSDIAVANLRPSFRSRWRASAVAAAIAAIGIGLVSRRFQMLGDCVGCPSATTGSGRAGGRCIGGIGCWPGIGRRPGTGRQPGIG